MFAASGKAGMCQQHDRRLRPIDPGQGQAIDVQSRVGADRPAKQRVQFAVQKFGNVVGDFQRHRFLGGRSLTKVAHRRRGHFHDLRRDAQAKLSSSQGRCGQFRRPRNDVERGLDGRQIRFSFIGQDETARQAPKQRDAESFLERFHLLAYGTWRDTQLVGGARETEMARSHFKRAQTVEGWQPMTHPEILLLDEQNVMHQIFCVNRSIQFVCASPGVCDIRAREASSISERRMSKDPISMTATDDVKTIEGVIQCYLDGLYAGDADKIAGVFHPTSALTSVTGEGELVITPRDSWLDKVRARPSPKQQGLSRHDQVLAIDLISPTMAYVRLKCAIPPRFFTDQLSLLKIDGRWQIAQKVFMTEMRE